MKSFAFGILFIIFFGCGDSSTTLQGGSGTINGFANLRDTNGNELFDHSGVRVKILETSQEAITDADGQWTLSNTPTTNITLIFTKDGYAEHRDINYSVQGTTINYYGLRKLYRVRIYTPSLVLRPFDISSDTNLHGAMIAIFSSSINELNAAKEFSGVAKIFFSAKQNIDPSNPATYIYSSGFKDYDLKTGIANLTIFKDSLVKVGFTAKSIIYCKAFAANTFTKDEGYIDNTTGRKAYEGFSPVHSEEKSFVLP